MPSKKKSAPKKATKPAPKSENIVKVEEAIETEATRMQKIRAYKDQQATDFNKKFRK